MGRLTLLPLFSYERQGVVLEDQVKLNFVMAKMIASRSSRKSTYTTLLRFPEEGDGSHSNFVVEALLAY